MNRIISALASGLIFGIGIAISGMGNPAKVINFFDVLGTWDPSLAFERWSRNFGPFVKMDFLMREMIQNDEEKEPRARVQGQGCA